MFFLNLKNVWPFGPYIFPQRALATYVQLSAFPLNAQAISRQQHLKLIVTQPYTKRHNAKVRRGLSYTRHIIRVFVFASFPQRYPLRYPFCFSEFQLGSGYQASFSGMIITANNNSIQWSNTDECHQSSMPLGYV